MTNAGPALAASQGPYSDQVEEKVCGKRSCSDQLFSPKRRALSTPLEEGFKHFCVTRDDPVVGPYGEINRLLRDLHFEAQSRRPSGHDQRR
mmetsp:Transcript_38/g.73  ORF Transcript_38/g.73 Transcript_38/m.73 type:complete len:91 (+) Transcript_38:12-284(+)